MSKSVAIDQDGSRHLLPQLSAKVPHLHAQAICGAEPTHSNGWLTVFPVESGRGVTCLKCRARVQDPALIRERIMSKAGMKDHVETPWCAEIGCCPVTEGK